MIFLLQHLLEKSAQVYANKTAVVFKEIQMTYGDLDEISDRLAAVLLERGVKRGDRVGIYLGKSLEAIVSIFGILKAGGVYVPIDPNSPKARLAYILNDCGIGHLITSIQQLPSLEEALSDAADSPLDAVILTEDERVSAERGLVDASLVTWKNVERAPRLMRSVSGVNTDLAYILYTSGSTGVPKGVMISHRAALTFINWTYEYFEISEKDVVSNHAPFHFDLSIFDIFTTIKAGGTVVLVPDQMSTFPVTLSQFIRNQKITVWYSVPSALILMLARGNFAKYAYPDLRLILFAGEVFPIKYLRTLKECTPARLFNLYGPTETNVCTFYEVTDISADRITPVPIGTAIANYEVFAVNDHGQFIKPGEIGELYARGPGLMSGYWGDPEKTAQVLLPNTFQPYFEEKLCRTGDLVMIDDDRNYIYLGRRDHMIKSRGYRIELGEIETVLYSHPRITEAAVVAIPDEEVTNRLKAFIVTEAPNAVTAEELRGYCQNRIPKYMIPEMIEFRESLPKTSTGKIERKALVKS